MVTTCTLASSSSPTRRHSGKNHSSLGSLISTRSWPENCSSNHSRTSMLTCSSRQSLAVSAQAVGLASEACTLAWRRYCVCLSTTHCGSPKPRGLLSSAFTHGLGTWKPRLPTTLENRLVPLRPEPATSNSCLLTRCHPLIVRRLRGRGHARRRNQSGFTAATVDGRSPYVGGPTQNRCRRTVKAQRRVGAPEVVDDVHPLRALYTNDFFWQGRSPSERVEELPFAPLSLEVVLLEACIGPVAELVLVEPLELEAYPVRYLE